MRCTTKIVFIALLAGGTVTAQKPVGVAGFVGNYLDYFTVKGGLPSGDTYYFTAWAANSMLSSFPDPTGLPIIGTLNDGTNGGCGGNIELVQLSKLPSPFVTSTTSNTQITPYSNCLSSFGSAPGAISAPTGWSGQLTGGDAHNDGTWKGTVMAFRNNILLAPVYRQTSQGNAYGDSTMILSPDAGQTWIDYGRYNTYTVTGASCSGTTVTLNVTNALSAGQKIYVHDIVPSGYNGKATLTAATGSTVQYTVGGCPGTYTSGGAFGILSTDGSAPFGPGDASYPTDMMWIGSGQMGVQSIIIYGQDGNYPAGIEAACDPTVYVCGVSFTKAPSTYPMYLYRAPIGQEMNKASYQWYSCNGYSTLWPVADTVCDGNQSSSWTSTIGSATVLMPTRRFGSGARPGECFALRYLPSHGSYLLSCLQESYVFAGPRLGFYWAPHPWGPYYPTFNSECIDNPGANCDTGFPVLAPYQENIISTTPPRTQMRMSMNSGPGRHTPGGDPSFWAVEAADGKVPATGMARRGDWLGGFGYTGMGHRFVSSNMAGGISRRGAAINGAYSLDWWFDLWDHGGDANATDRPHFRDLVSGGTKYLSVFCDAGNQFAQGASLLADGVRLIESGYNAKMQGNFSDSTFSASSGNSSWTFVSVFKITNPSGAGVTNHFGRAIPVLGTTGGNVNTSVDVYVGRVTPGDVCVQWGGVFTANPTSICTTSAVISQNVWYYLAISAQANGSGFPTITMYLGSAGTITEYGGISLATSANGTAAGGLTKTCSAYCSTTPAVVSGGMDLGYDPTDGESINGNVGEAGLYLGVVPGHAIREIYHTLRTDWARVGRGTL